MQLHKMTIYFSSKIPKDTYFYIENMLKIVNKAKKKKKKLFKNITRFWIVLTLMGPFDFWVELIFMGLFDFWVELILMSTFGKQQACNLF